MEIFGWGLIIISFVIGFIGLVYPIIPSVIFIVGGFLLYGVFFSFAELPWWFWLIEVLFVILLFGADMMANAFGVKKYGGSKAGIWGSTIGLLIGPIVLPFAGIILGPFLGAIIAELLFARTSIKQAIKTGFGSVIGFLTSVITKGIVQIVMIVIFFWVV
ncbi:hypothetical protein HMPREF1210_00411 [Paenisporosarcina sp. HGH0030]|uniref:DUF456 domain-containing protein n=1 Tax=Paenisporosarcina sp. HGH0030 TaxID=1078085 RepID=UPI00034E8893|nr:DUF456 family protein [Paenisporosarcina sp. HGH0030]EPD53588.1 hypothetical protein HMPREF1210_00411 [Paenisporosarcina sp. HGH0030]